MEYETDTRPELKVVDNPVEALTPGSPHHTYLLAQLVQRIEASERAMSDFYPRWTYSEKRVQAYIAHNDYEKMLKSLNDNKGPQAVVSITVPYAYATINTIVTYLMHTFTGRKPMFQVGSYKAETANRARMMEIALQYNADHVRLVKNFYQYFNDGELYGLGVLRTAWKTKRAKRTVWTTKPKTFMGVQVGGMVREKIKEERVVFQGTEVDSIDPFMFFPDPRVPMSDVSRKGEFVFWRTFEGRHSLELAAANGELHHIDAVGEQQQSYQLNSVRNLKSNGESHPGARDGKQYDLKNFVQIDQGTVVIVPAKWGLSATTTPEKWLFTIGNKKQILAAEPLDADHDMHPVCVIEPYSLGYGFGQAGLGDYLGETQDTISWFLNSHIHNVRAALNNILIVDPSRIEMQDLKTPGPGKIVRTKNIAYGQDIRQFIQQLDIRDVTQGHMRDLDTFMRIGDTLSAINDNLRGVQDSGSRKTATEVRTSGEAAASRLASHAKLISAQGVVDLTTQMCLNMQQNLEEEFFLQIVGERGAQEDMTISPDQLVGDFYFPIHDGTLPLDRVALVDVWKELYLGIAQDEGLRQQYNLPAIFEHIAELGGATNVSKFRIDVASPGAQPPTNAMPLNDALAGLG